MGLVSLSNGMARLVELIGRLAGLLAVGLMLVIVSDVLLRRWFVIGSTQLQELEWHLHGALFLLSLGWAYITDSHVRIEVVSERLKPRTRAWIEVIGILALLLPYVGALLWFGYDYVMVSFAYNESSPSASGLPARYIIKSALVFGVAVLGLAALSRLIDVLVFLFGPIGDRGRTRFIRNVMAPHRGEVS